MWNLSLPWWEFVVRGVIVYAFLILILRISGKRQVGQLAPFDLVLLLVLSNAVQNAMNGGDNSVVGGLISATVLIGANYIVGALTFRSKKLEEIIEGRPLLLIHNGKLFEDVMAKAQLTHHELNSALRQAGCDCVSEVHCAVLENNGAITVTERARGAESA
ncbi:MAG: DUF421 domain-containing protein [Thermoanaerobaculia bacterium]